MKRRDWEKEIEIAWALCVFIAILGAFAVLYAVFLL